MTQNEIITALIAISGWALATLQTMLGFYERKKQKKDETLLRTVEYFTEGAQKRSVGISLIQGLILRKKAYSEIIAPLLTNQFVYLSLSSDSENAAHEKRNWHTRNEVLDAIGRRLENGEISSINISKQTLELWIKGLNE